MAWIRSFYSRGEALLKAVLFIKRDERSDAEKFAEKIAVFAGDPITNARIYTQYAEQGKYDYYKLGRIKDINDTVIADYY